MSPKDPSDPKKPDQRTRLNAELAHQYSQQRRRRVGELDEATPGRNSLTGEVEEKDVDAVEGELEEKAVSAPQAEASAKKSIFDLPRKEPSRQPLLNADSIVSIPLPAPPPPPPPPDAPAPSADKPKGGNRG